LLSTHLAGCSTARRTLGLVNNIDISLRATPDVNPDAQGNPSPILVRFYELSAAEAFRQADFTTLFNNEQAAIGKDLVRRDEFELKPEQNRNIVRKAKRDAKYLGVLAAYHNTANIKWRAIISLNPDGTTELVLNLEKTGITVSRD
jgi:type VI secretion system protein VasD